MRFLVGVLFGILLVVAGGAAVILTGSYNTAATIPPGKLEKQIAGFALDRSVAKRAPQRKNPYTATPEVIREALEEYREHCLVCHGAPGVDAGDIGTGLNPPPPDLTIPKVQARSDGELYWLTSEGIRLTGMPAFGPHESEEDIWKIVAFLRHLPELTDEEQRQLRQREEEDAAPTPVEGPPPPAAAVTPQP
jgi:mono/diheme cytochrome c family protein